MRTHLEFKLKTILFNADIDSEHASLITESSSKLNLSQLGILVGLFEREPKSIDRYLVVIKGLQRVGSETPVTEIQTLLESVLGQFPTRL
jgi:hypothetical protein